MPPPSDDRSTLKKRQQELRRQLANTLLSQESPVKEANTYRKDWQRHWDLCERKQSLALRDSKLLNVLPGIEPRDRQVAEATKAVKHENKILNQFAADLGKTAFAAVRSGNVVATRRFDVRRTLHEHLEALNREKDDLGRTDASKLTEKVKLKARQLKLAAEIKIGQLKIGSLDRTLGESLLNDNEESSVDCSQTREVLEAITRQRATIAATIKKQGHAQSQLAATLADVARTLDRKSVESGAVLQAELKQVRRETRRIEKSIAKAREAIVSKALEDKLLRDSTQLGPKLKQLWSTQFDLKASKSKAANKVAGRLSQPVKYTIYGAVVCLLLIIAGLWFGSGDEGSQSLSEKDKKPESTAPGTSPAPSAADKEEPPLPQDNETPRSTSPDGTASTKPSPSSATRPNLTLEKSPSLDKLIRLTMFGTAEEKADAQRLLDAVRTAAKSGLPEVAPDLQRMVVDFLPRLMSKKDANTVIYAGMTDAGAPHPDTIVAVPDAPNRKATIIQIQTLVCFGTAREREDGRRLSDAMIVAKEQGLNAVHPQLQRTVIDWLEPFYGKKEADRILGQ